MSSTDQLDTKEFTPNDGEGGREAHTRDVTQLLRAWSEGDHQALEKLTPLVYQELHRRAHRQMAQERAGQILQTTAIVNEIYVQVDRSATRSPL